METKTCTKCNLAQPLTEFHRNTKCAGGLVSQCKSCRSVYRAEYTRRPDVRERLNKQMREWKKANPDKIQRYDRHKALKRNYGITRQDYDLMLEKQENRCAICREPTSNLFVDHCHATKRVRALLCFHCNTALGHFRDDPVRLQSALDYLVAHRDYHEAELDRLGWHRAEHKVAYE